MWQVINGINHFELISDSSNYQLILNAGKDLWVKCFCKLEKHSLHQTHTHTATSLFDRYLLFTTAILRSYEKQCFPMTVCSPGGGTQVNDMRIRGMSQNICTVDYCANKY